MTELPEHHKLLDTQGLYCPEPVMLLHSAIAEVEINEVVKVVATDPSTERDIPKFCEFLGHELVFTETNTNTFDFYIRRAS